MSIYNKTDIAVLGAGSWGTALSLLVSQSHGSVTLWSSKDSHASQIENTRTNEKYLPGIDLSKNITVTSDLEHALHAKRIIIAVPSHGFRDLLVKISNILKVKQTKSIICWGTKGFEPKTSSLLKDVFDEVLGEQATPTTVSGPSFALEVAQSLPTALTVAGKNFEDASVVADWFRNSRTRVYTSKDMLGVQICGAIKNVIAIAVGISDGLGFGANAKAALITRGLAEMSRFGIAMGADIDTFTGLTGVGDLILTCTDDQSRNRRIGLSIGKGKKLKDAVLAIHQEAEGINTTRELHKKSRALGIDMPICEQVYNVLYDNLKPTLAVEALLARKPTNEKR